MYGSGHSPTYTVVDTVHVSVLVTQSDMKQRNQKEIEYIITKMNEKKEKVILQAKEKMTEIHEGKMEAMKNNYTAIIEVHANKIFNSGD